MKTQFYYALVCIQLLVVLILAVQINKGNRILGQASINPISKENMVPNTHSKLNYYYEPKHNIHIDEVKMSWLPKKVQYVINKDGFNETKNYTISKSENIFRIITLGDSFTFGLFVNTNENWSEQLEELLNQYIKNCNLVQTIEVINLGVPGYDIQYSVERFKLNGKQYNPNMILWLLKDDDFLELNEVMRAKEKEYIQKMKETGEYYDLLKKGIPYPEMIKMHEEMERFQKKTSIQSILKIQENFLEELNTSYEGKIIYITFPYTNNEQMKMMKDISEKYSGEIAIITNIYDDDKIEQLTFAPNDYHPTTAGHKVIAKDIYNYLMNEHVVPCN